MLWLILGLVIAQRLVELRVAKRHTRILQALGGYEIGRDQYRWIVRMHGAFFLSLIIECAVLGKYGAAIAWVPFGIFLAAQALRIWSMRTLGVHWNTRIVVLPGSLPVRSGPYRWIKHPNYLAVTIELAMLPLAFHAYVTACVFSVLNFIAVRRRIAMEELALREATTYEEVMAGKRPGFFWSV